MSCTTKQKDAVLHHKPNPLESQVTLYHTTWTGSKKSKVTSLRVLKGFWVSHINSDPTVPPKRVPYRPVPIQQQEEFKCQLAKMQHVSIIVPVHKVTPWVSSYVIVESADKKIQEKDVHLPTSNSSQ